MRTLVLLFGVIFLFFGITGFIPNDFLKDFFLKVFKFNISLNVLHLITGIIALAMIWASRRKCLLFFQILGSLYALIALLGFIYGDTDILGIFASNRPDTWLHMIIAIAALVLGYGSTD